MFVAVVVVIIGDHLFWFTFEAHRLIATRASDTVASVDPDHWYFALIVRTLSDAVLFHVLFESCVPAIFGLLACQPRMVPHLHRIWFTLHSTQKLVRQTSH